MNTHELKKESNDVYLYRKRIHTQKDEKQTNKKGRRLFYEC